MSSVLNLPSAQMTLPDGMSSAFMRWSASRPWLTYRICEGDVATVFLAPCATTNVLMADHMRGAWSREECACIK